MEIEREREREREREKEREKKYSSAKAQNEFFELKANIIPRKISVKKKSM